jgi:hypothetical protein
MSHLLLIAMLLLSSAASSAASLSTSDGVLDLWAGDSTGHRSRTVFFGPEYAESDAVTNQVNGAHAEATYNFAQNEIRVSYNLLRPPFQDDPGLGTLEVAISEGRINFTVDEAVEYALDARMSILDPEGRNTHQWLRLFEDHVRIFDNFQLSDSTPDQQFILGATDGDLNNSLEGTLSGFLVPGRVYRLEYSSRLIDAPTPSLQTATASGFYSLRIIPEPSTALLMGLGLATLGARKRR